MANHLFRPWPRAICEQSNLQRSIISQNWKNNFPISRTSSHATIVYFQPSIWLYFLCGCAGQEVLKKWTENSKLTLSNLVNSVLCSILNSISSIKSSYALKLTPYYNIFVLFFCLTLPTLDSGINVAPWIKVAPGKLVKKNEHSPIHTLYLYY